MKFRSTLLLLLALALLSGAYWGMRRHGRRQVEEAAVAARLFPFAGKDVRRLTVAQVSRPAVTGERGPDGKWRITAPNDTIPPLQPLWDRVADSLSTLRNQRTVAETVADPAQYGLDVPALTVTVEAGDAPPATLVFGDVEPTQRHRYARLNDGPLFLAATEEFFEVNRSLEELRHRFLVEDREADILEFRFAWIWTGSDAAPPEEQPAVGEESTEVVVRRADAASEWRLIAPLEAAADQEKVAEAVNEVQFAVGRDFVDAPENLSDYGLSPAAARITVMDARNGRARNILLGEVDGEKGGVWAQVSGQKAVFLMDAQIMMLLPRKPDGWRETRLITRRLSELKKVEYRRGEETLVLERGADGAWSLVSPALPEVNQFAVSGFLAVLKESRGEPLDAAPETLPGGGAPQVAITLSHDDGASATLSLWPGAGEASLWYATQDSGGVVALRGVAADALLLTADTFRSKELLRVSRPDVEGLEFQFENLGVVLEKRHGQWVVTRPETLRLKNQSDAEALLAAVSPLRITGLAAPEAPPDLSVYGLDKPVFTLYVRMAPVAPPAAGERIGPLRIGGVSPENSRERFATLEGKAGVFRVSQDAVDALRDAVQGLEEVSSS
ncbi:MAG TPA: DUF4340 domain-containing protein [Candidatus Hydrogenedentes bacterium]|nr:DUF4340 domain-containing protein [Candidatus Hydrogenedentota bacterium]